MVQCTVKWIDLVSHVVHFYDVRSPGKWTPSFDQLVEVYVQYIMRYGNSQILFIMTV